MGSLLQMHFFFVARADDFTRNKCFNGASKKDQSSQIFICRLIVMLKITPQTQHPHPPAHNWGMLLFPSSSKYHPQCIPTVTGASGGPSILKFKELLFFRNSIFNHIRFFSREDQDVRSPEWKLHFEVFHILCVISPAPHTNIPPTWHFAQIWKHFQVVSQPKTVNFLWIKFRTSPVYGKFDMLPGSSKIPLLFIHINTIPPSGPYWSPDLRKGIQPRSLPQDRIGPNLRSCHHFLLRFLQPHRPHPKQSSFCLHVQLWSLPPGRTEIGDDNVCHWLKVVWGSVSTKLLCCHTLIILLNVSLLLFMFSKGVQTIFPNIFHSNSKGLPHLYLFAWKIPNASIFYQIFKCSR